MDITLLVTIAVAAIGVLPGLSALLSQRRINAQIEIKYRVESQKEVAEIYEAQARTSKTQTDSAAEIVDLYRRLAEERALEIDDLKTRLAACESQNTKELNDTQDLDY
jgi:hypothetical protein